MGILECLLTFIYISIKVSLVVILYRAGFAVRYCSIQTWQTVIFCTEGDLDSGTRVVLLFYQASTVVNIVCVGHCIPAATFFFSPRS